jgi:hypothetical protein
VSFDPRRFSYCCLGGTTPFPLSSYAFFETVDGPRRCVWSRGAYGGQGSFSAVAREVSVHVVMRRQYAYATGRKFRFALATINNASPKGEAWCGALATINEASPKGELALPEQLELLYGLISHLAISMERRWLNLSVMILQTLIASHRMTTSFAVMHESLFLALFRYAGAV